MPDILSLSTTSVLAFGFVLGLKHAIEVDHLAAVSTIVSERKSIFASALVGGLWGIGHTLSLFLAGVLVILLHYEITDRVALGLEFIVGLMLVFLGVNALRKLWRGGHLHLHTHRHGGREHVHPHIHEPQENEADPQRHHGVRPNMRPLVVGMIHGLAGSAALMLLVLTTIQSPWVGLLYIVVFGVGSVGGMMLMSALVGLPLYLTARNFTRANFLMRGLAGIGSVGFGLFMIYQIGIAGDLFR